MKKLYSKQLGSEVYALAPEQLKVFASSGYEVPRRKPSLQTRALSASFPRQESARMRYSNSRRALLSFARPPKR